MRPFATPYLLARLLAGLAAAGLLKGAVHRSSSSILQADRAGSEWISARVLCVLVCVHPPALAPTAILPASASLPCSHVFVMGDNR